mmetsp:Transcript_20946/g.49751  ORF Transcript_20946/g.49751 Transcript_20946/m.49751 type:complete len:251 (+) Transcript_20946:1059-1811(+)
MLCTRASCSVCVTFEPTIREFFLRDTMDEFVAIRILFLDSRSFLLTFLPTTRDCVWSNPIDVFVAFASFSFDCLNPVFRRTEVVLAVLETLSSPLFVASFDRTNPVFRRTEVELTVFDTRSRPTFVASFDRTIPVFRRIEVELAVFDILSNPFFVASFDRTIPIFRRADVELAVFDTRSRPSFVASFVCSMVGNGIDPIAFCNKPMPCFDLKTADLNIRSMTFGTRGSPAFHAPFSRYDCSDGISTDAIN